MVMLLGMAFLSLPVPNIYERSLMDRLKEIRELRTLQAEHLSVAQSIAGLTRQFDLTTEQLAECGSDLPLLTVKANVVEASSLYRPGERVKVSLEPELDGSSKVTVAWMSREKKHTTVVRVFRERGEAYLEPSRRAIPPNSCVVLRNRVRVGLRLADTESLVWVVNGPAYTEARFSDEESTFRPVAFELPRRLPPPDHCTCILALSDDFVRILEPEERVPLPTPGMDVEDRLFFQTFTAWRCRWSGTETSAQERLVSAYARFETADRPIDFSKLPEQLQAIAAGTAGARALVTALKPVVLEIGALNSHLAALRLEDTEIRWKLRELRQWRLLEEGVTVRERGQSQ
jgi:hypothetical protein